jgi:hypothetical protein
MSSWGNNDNAANTPLWAAMQVGKTPNSANQTLIFDNTTLDAFAVDLPSGGSRYKNITVGVFGVDAQEAAADHKGAHTGWVMRTVGTGGRAGRVQEEVLVAMSTLNSSDADGQTYANVEITITGASNASVLSDVAFGNLATFSISTSLKGNTSASLTYQWQYLNGSTWANIPANTAPIRWANATTTTLHARPATTANNGTVLRAKVTAADQGVVAYSANATLSIPA